MHFLGWPVVINESLVQSYTGQIRVAPVKLKNTARFARLRTEGAFLLSGEIQSGGKVSYLAITSEAGVPCNLVRPWDGPVRVRRAGFDGGGDRGREGWRADVPHGRRNHLRGGSPG